MRTKYFYVSHLTKDNYRLRATAMRNQAHHVTVLHQACQQHNSSMMHAEILTGQPESFALHRKTEPSLILVYSS